MTTEAKIRKAFDKQYSFLADYEKEEQYPVFKAGYLALLNELEQTAYIYINDEFKFTSRVVLNQDNDWHPSWKPEKLYRLPEGVTKP